MRFVQWIKSLFKKPEVQPQPVSPIEETFVRVQEQLIVQELKLIQQEPVQPKRVAPRLSYQEWIENARAVESYFAKTRYAA